MKKLLFLTCAGLLLIGAGCTSVTQPVASNNVPVTPPAVEPAQPSQPVVPPSQPVAVQNSWWLTFTLPSGWVQTTELGGQDKPEYAPLSKDGAVVIVNTTKYFYPSSGVALNWMSVPQYAQNVDSGVATGIIISKLSADEQLSTSVQPLANNVFKEKMCDAGGDCQIGGSWTHDYYLKTPDGLFRASVVGPDEGKQMTSVVEGILTSAKPANQ
jgi:hypothetical protein